MTGETAKWLKKKIAILRKCNTLEKTLDAIESRGYAIDLDSDTYGDAAENEYWLYHIHIQSLGKGWSHYSKKRLDLARRALCWVIDQEKGGE